MKASSVTASKREFDIYVDFRAFQRFVTKKVLDVIRVIRFHAIKFAQKERFAGALGLKLLGEKSMNLDDYDAIVNCPEPSQPHSPIANVTLTPKKRGGNLRGLLGCLSSPKQQERY